MKKLTAIIADDEPLLRAHLQKMLAEVWLDLDVICLSSNGTEALAAIEKYQPDFAFLDIKMPEIDGMTVAKKLLTQSSPPLITFISAYDEYAVNAFENNAVDYILKPISKNRLIKACDKLKERKQLQQSNNKENTPDNAVLVDLLDKIQQLTTKASPDHLSWIKAYKGDDLHLISINDILYFKAEHKYTSVFADTQEQTGEYLIRTSLKELQQKIDPEQFWQIHRSSIVNAGKIDRVKKDLFGHMKVYIGKHKLPVSRNAQSLFKGM